MFRSPTKNKLLLQISLTRFKLSHVLINKLALKRYSKLKEISIIFYSDVTKLIILVKDRHKPIIHL